MLSPSEAYRECEKNYKKVIKNFLANLEINVQGLHWVNQCVFKKLMF